MLATRAIARLISVCGITLPVILLFRVPTVAELVAEVEKHLLHGFEQDDLAELIDEIEGLSDEEAALPPIPLQGQADVTSCNRLPHEKLTRKAAV